jgi:hypothetical protein
MMALGLMLVALSDARVALITAVRLEAEDDRAVVRIVVSGPIGAARMQRDGGDLVVLVPGAQAAPGLAVPAPVAEVQALALRSTPDGTQVRIRLERDLGYDLGQEPGLVTVVLRPAAVAAASVAPAAVVPAVVTPPAVAAPRRPPPDVRDLYAKILPPPAGEGPQGQPGAGTERALDPAEQDGLRIGPIRVRPSVVVSYLDASTAFLDTPQPVRDQYFQIEPHLGFGLGARLPLPGHGRLQLLYEPRFRVGSSFDVLRRPTHLATASADLPIGPSATLRGSHHYARGLLETTEVDPGREYFFRLAPFVRHQTSAGLALNPGGRLGLDLSAGRDSVRIDDAGGFFDHRTDTLASDVNYQVGTDARMYLRYQWHRVPPPAERPIAEARGSTVSLGVAGEVMPLMTADLSVGWRRLDAPRAGAGGNTFRGTIAAVTLRKEFTPAASLTVTGRRETYPSAFEDNAFYVSTGAGAETDLGLPLSLVFHGGVAWQRNAYRVAATGLGVPRRDDLIGWSAGIGRSLTRWAFVRTDYRRDRRTSNLAALESTGHVFMVELGVGYLGGSTAGQAPR